MKRLVFFITLSVLLSNSLFSQKSHKVSVKYTYYVPETVSIDEAKRIALERAKIQAIADEFGTAVSQTVSIHVDNDNSISKTNMVSTGHNEINGEWVETIGEPSYDILYEGGMLAVTVHLKGKARLRSNIQIPLSIKILRNGTTSQYENHEFRSGDNLYLSFQSPISGSLLVYLIDYVSDNAYCLLPYSISNDNSQSIEGNKEYIFFSEEHAPNGEKQRVDEYILDCTGSSKTEHNDLVIIFSPTNLVKSNTSKTNAETPRQLSRIDFEKWKSQLRVQFSEIQIITNQILITQ